MSARIRCGTSRSLQVVDGHEVVGTRIAHCVLTEPWPAALITTTPKVEGVEEVQIQLQWTHDKS